VWMVIRKSQSEESGRGFESRQRDGGGGME
jgi:hypothetical protein